MSIDTHEKRRPRLLDICCGEGVPPQYSEFLGKQLRDYLHEFQDFPPLDEQENEKRRKTPGIQIWERGARPGTHVFMSSGTHEDKQPVEQLLIKQGRLI